LTETTATPATRPVSSMQKAVPAVVFSEFANTVPVVQAEYDGIEPPGRVIHPKHATAY
jgi:hypothetical protein